MTYDKIRVTFRRIVEFVNKKAALLNLLKFMIDQKEYLFNLREDIEEKYIPINIHPQVRNNLKTLLNNWEMVVTKFPNKTN